MSSTNRDVMLNRTKEDYKNDKERLREQARDKYKSLSEEKKQKIKEYQKIIVKQRQLLGILVK